MKVGGDGKAEIDSRRWRLQTRCKNERSVVFWLCNEQVREVPILRKRRREIMPRGCEEKVGCCRVVVVLGWRFRWTRGKVRIWFATVLSKSKTNAEMGLARFILNSRFVLVLRCYSKPLRLA